MTFVFKYPCIFIYKVRLVKEIISFYISEFVMLHDWDSVLRNWFFVYQSIIRCDEDEAHVASVYCTVCATHLCSECSQVTHSTKTLAKHKRVPLADKPHEKTMCSQHQVHAIEFVCLEEGCQTSPLMCCVCKEYGKHQGHKVWI